MEIWKDIDGYKGAYQVSNLGSIRNVKSGRILKGSVNSYGYQRVSFSDGGRFKVHRLVATAFIANPNSLPAVDHIDEDKTNNKVSNLRWCTPEQNLDYYNEPRGRGKFRKVPLTGKKNKKYKNLKAMIEDTGKSITVDGKSFISCGSAAQYIVDNTEGKNKATISKELRRYLQGKKSSWVMYDRFTIGY